MHSHHNPYIEKALKKLEVLSHDPTMRVEYEAKQKFLRDYAWEMAVAKEDSRAEGKAEGQKEIAHAMLKEGLPVEMVRKISQLSLEVVLNLKSNL